MRTSERHQLKQDKFAQTTKDLITGAVEHRSGLLQGVTIAAVVAALAVGIVWYARYRGEQADSELAKAMQTYDTRVRLANEPLTPDTPSFASSQERATAAHTQFQQVADRYSHSDAGKLARYMSGLTALDKGDTGAAEKDLKSVADTGNQDLASLAKLALANLYRSSNRVPEAKKLYEELIAAPTNSVSKPAVQLELAAMYAANSQIGEANKVYAEIVKDNTPAPVTPGTSAAKTKPEVSTGSPTAAQIAQQRLQGK